MLMARVGSTETYESCVNFVSGDAGGGPRFKIDPNGAWGDAVPAQDYIVASGWVKIYFDAITKKITTKENLAANCVTASANYHLRGTFNGWAEGTLMTRLGTSEIYESCQNFVGGDAGGGPRFKIDLNGGWGNDAIPTTDFSVAAGWVKVSYDNLEKVITVEENQAVDCGSNNIGSSSSSMSSSSSSMSSSSSSSSSTAPTTEFHLRGTHNAWAEGDLFSPVSGSATNLEICRNFSAGDANGGPRFKVDPNGAWGNDSFPAQDESANGWTRIEVSTTSASIISKTTNLGENCTEAPVADDFRARTIYFLFVDRFHNGDTTNDNGIGAAAGTSTIKGPGALSEWKKYWGGDIQGLIDKLDYLQALGITAIWVTPIVDNVNAGTQGAYHGYWARDFYEVDEHLGSWALVDELNVQTEARGMKLVLDIALNHSNPNNEFESGALYKEGAFLTDFASGSGTWYHNNGSVSDCGDTNPATTCNNEWDEPWAATNKSLFNLTDFNHGITANSQADTYLINAALKWMDHGIDAFRIDAIKHIEPSFINRFSAAVKAKKADTYIFGEWFGAGAGNTGSMTFLGENRGSELLDFVLRDRIEGAIAGDITMTALSAHIQTRPAAMGNKEDLQPIFLDNHDNPRTSVYLQTGAMVNNGRTGKSMPKAFADARQNLGMALVMTLPGVPAIYYGSEQNTTWFVAEGGTMGQDPYNREQMPSFSTTTPAFTMISALANLRKVSPAIQRGTYAERWTSASGDVLVFQRQEGSDCAVVAVNRGAATTITVPNLCLANAAYTSKVGTDVVNVTSGSGTFNLSQNEVVVLH